jgi:hypothetical protein
MTIEKDFTYKILPNGQKECAVAIIADTKNANPKLSKKRYTKKIFYLEDLYEKGKLFNAIYKKCK